jgi:protein-S-isoprenylcysteine O-methyltransferase Ste14
MLLMLFAVGLALRSWVALILVTVPPVLALLYRIHVEERALAQEFGPDYTAYCESTKRLIPVVY